MPDQTLLKVKNLCVTLENRSIIKDVSFSVERGKALAVIGPNGAGKTMLMRALLDTIPHTGSVAWRRKTKIGYVPQRLSLDRFMPVTVEEFLRLKTKGFWTGKKSFLEHRDHELGLVGLPVSAIEKQISELSGGEFQRLMIAWALVTHPDILLLDEPTSGIDIGSEETIYNLVHRLQKERGLAVILVSHDLNVVYRYADQVLCLNKRMICFGAPREILTPQELKEIYGAAEFYAHGNAHVHHQKL